MGFGWRGGRCGRERHMGRVRFARLRGSGRGRDIFFGGGVGGGGVLACGGVGAAADFEELFVDLGGGEVGEGVEVGILRGGEGEFAFGVASISKWFHVLDTSNHASTFGSRYTNAVGVYTVRHARSMVQQLPSFTAKPAS